MSYTSSSGKWVDTAGLDDWYEADKPVSAYRSQILINNINHLRDVHTHTRISQTTIVGGTIVSSDIAGDDPSILCQYVVPWTTLAPRTLATPVLRIGGFRGSAGTSELSAGLFPMNARPDGDGRSNAIAWWDETAFTNTTSAVIIDGEETVTYPGSTVSTPLGRVRRRSSLAPTALREKFRGEDPQSDGTMAPSSVTTIMVQLAIFGRSSGGGSATIHLTLVELREYGGGTP